MSNELKAIEAEYGRLTEEIRSRYMHHYHFHYLVLVILGAAIALFSRDGVPTSVLRNVFLAGPFIFFPAILLMLKEHAYMDLRERYIDSVLKPRFRQLLADEPDIPHPHHSLLGWYRWEENETRGTAGRCVIYGFFGIAEYLLPLVLSVASLVGSWVLSRAQWTLLTMGFFVVGAASVLGAVAIILFLRIAIPHVPKISSIEEKQNTDSAQQQARQVSFESATGASPDEPAA